MLTIILLSIGSLLPAAVPSVDLPNSIALSIDRELGSDSASASEPLALPYLTEIEDAAHHHHLPFALLAGVIQEESRFDEWASRAEPAYMNSKRVAREADEWSRAHQGIPTPYTERLDRSRSYGLMQVMGETARAEGYTQRYLTQLFLASDGLAAGARHLRMLLDRYGRDTLAAISAYNQGSARRVRGAFANARYVYRVTIAWRMYESLARKEHPDE